MPEADRVVSSSISESSNVKISKKYITTLPSQKAMGSWVRMYFCKSDVNLEIINRQFFLPLYSLPV